MPRTPRASQGGYCYHVLNRGNGRGTVFHKDGDFAAFLKLLRQADERTPMRLLAYCLMLNHFHLALWPREDGDLSDYMMWLMTAHVRRYHQHYHSSGHVWQGRSRAFPIQEDEHLLTVLRYIERNPVRADLVRRAQDWPWSSAAPPSPGSATVDPGPVVRRAGCATSTSRRPKPSLNVCERVSAAAGRLGMPCGWRRQPVGVVWRPACVHAAGRRSCPPPRPPCSTVMGAE
ncbi:MAG TPA: transposase [Gemmataceae bacterium]|nr:transposase [Gemmataceae bacterium]